jgi:hypothetical protein
MSISRFTLLLAVAASFVTAPVWAEDLATTVAGKLRDSGAMSGYRVNVKAKAGTVWLEGRVADDKQLSAALGVAESTPGVERVVNRLVVEPQGGASGPSSLGLPASAWNVAGVDRPDSTPAAKPIAKNQPAGIAKGLFSSQASPSREGGVQLAQATTPAPRSSPQARSPLPIGTPVGRPLPPPPMAGGRQGPNSRVAMRTNAMGEPMTLPAPGQVGGGQIVPGSMRFSEGPVEGVPAGVPGGPQMAGGPVAGGPMPMGGTGVGMPPVPMRGDGPNMPNYAWPSYAAYPNYAALQYPTQYSPTAWPYIGPFYPYPQVPLGWRRVSLEWDDGWWWLDFDERHHHSHHK